MYPPEKNMMGWVGAVVRQRKFPVWGIAAVLVVAMAAVAGGIAFGGTATCASTATLNGSAFEIDADANEVVNTAGCKDWLDIDPNQAGQQNKPDVIVKADSPSGANDESFGEGTKEDTALPTVVDGSIPPNKSDLKAFGAYTETGEIKTGNPTGKFLELFWSRVQDPSGTTNMDFELNKRACTPANQLPPNTTDSDCAPNGLTPLRSVGDKLITYDLSRGGTVATISIREWNGSAWGSSTVLTGTSAQARGTVNTSPITAANSISPLPGAQDPRTFGEASIAFSALFGANECGQFGSAYLKSRSSDSFTAALKDFVPPQNVSISNCAALTTTASNPPASPATIGDTLTDTAHLSGVATNAGGTITFKAYGPDSTPNDPSDNCSGTAAFTSNAITVNGPGDYTSNAFTPSATGTYYWIASYSGDSGNQSATGKCNDADETSVVVKASPSISTLAQTPVTIGSTINDTATLSGGVSPTGTITFKAYGPDSTPNDPSDNCSGTAAFTDTVNVTNGNGQYTSANFTPGTAGTYYWIASYSGDGNNTAVSGLCNDSGETSVVNKAPATIDTVQKLFPQDTATLSATAGGPVTGTVTFKLYGPNNPTCSESGAAPVYTMADVQLTSGTANTNNTSFWVNQTNSGDYKWLVTYSGDDTHNAATSACGKEAFTATVDNDTTTN